MGSSPAFFLSLPASHSILRQSKGIIALHEYLKLEDLAV
jgi:hypothetical protein